MLLWAAAGTLDDAARRTIEKGADGVYVSAASVWEIEIKRALGRLHAPDDLVAAVDAAGYTPLPISLEHSVAAARLPALHRDPFDRMLVAQASVEGMTLATADDAIRRYGTPSLAVRRA